MRSSDEELCEYMLLFGYRTAQTESRNFHEGSKFDRGVSRVARSTQYRSYKGQVQVFVCLRLVWHTNGADVEISIIGQLLPLLVPLVGTVFWSRHCF